MTPVPGEVHLPPPAVRRALAPLMADPGHSAIVTDFDGTLSPIVDDPTRARPLAGAVDLLERLSSRFAVVAVVSGRPVSFLVEHLSPPGRGGPPRPPGSAGTVHLVGLYGLERSAPDGSVIYEPGALRWRAAVAAAADRLQSSAPPGVVVEDKGLAVTVHWRRAPGAGGWAVAAATDAAVAGGLSAHPGRMSVELRPDLAVDKGSVVRDLVTGCAAACYLGDDLGDLPAFAALSDLAAEKGMDTVSVAVVDDESAVGVLEAADLTVSGPGAALSVLGWLAGP
jgi:trehalose 6-phosphate phosphatase